MTSKEGGAGDQLKIQMPEWWGLLRKAMVDRMLPGHVVLNSHSNRKRLESP